MRSAAKSLKILIDYVYEQPPAEIFGASAAANVETQIFYAVRIGREATRREADRNGCGLKNAEKSIDASH